MGYKEFNLIEEFRDILKQPCANIVDIKLENLFQELLKKQKTEDESLPFYMMREMRECYERIDKESKKRKENFQSINKYIRKILYYDWDGHEILQWEYGFKCEYFDNHVAFDVINGWEISTIWLGLDSITRYFERLHPMIFETMIFKKNETIQDKEEFIDFQKRYSSLDEAEKGHKEICELVTKTSTILNTETHVVGK